MFCIYAHKAVYPHQRKHVENIIKASGDVYADGIDKLCREGAVVDGYFPYFIGRAATESSAQYACGLLARFTPVTYEEYDERGYYED
jgi:hypothetical protein